MEIPLWCMSEFWLFLAKIPGPHDNESLINTIYIALLAFYLYLCIIAPLFIGCWKEGMNCLFACEQKHIKYSNGDRVN
jgi:hypothetical protein